MVIIIDRPIGAMGAIVGPGSASYGRGGLPVPLAVRNRRMVVRRIHAENLMTRFKRSTGRFKRSTGRLLYVQVQRLCFTGMFTSILNFILRTRPHFHRDLMIA